MKGGSGGHEMLCVLPQGGACPGTSVQTHRSPSCPVDCGPWGKMTCQCGFVLSDTGCLGGDIDNGGPRVVGLGM